MDLLTLQATIPSTEWLTKKFEMLIHLTNGHTLKIDTDYISTTRNMFSGKMVLQYWGTILPSSFWSSKKRTAKSLAKYINKKLTIEGDYLVDVVKRACQILDSLWARDVAFASQELAGMYVRVATYGQESLSVWLGWMKNVQKYIDQCKLGENGANFA